MIRIVSSSLSIHNDRNTAPNHANPNPAVFTVIYAVIKSREQKRGKHLICIGETDPVLTDIDLVLVLIPDEAHRDTASATRRLLGNAASLAPRAV